MKTIFTLIICVSLGVSARAQLTSQQLKDYVRNAWQITDLSDSAIASTLDTSYSGIPFKDWINGLDTAVQVNEQLQKQNYAEASKIAVSFATELGYNSLLEQAGLDGVASVAQLAEWPIQYALNDFVNTVKQKTFRDQCAYYFAARAHNTAEQISSAAPSAPLDADVNGGLLYKDNQGWLIRVTGYTTTVSVLGFNSSTQFYALAEKLWQAREQTKNLADESRDVASAFRQAATPSAPVITSSPNAQTITEGQTATFSVAATGSGTLTYRWRRDGVIVDGLIASSFTTDVVGCYQAEVINSVGSVFSVTACLTVQPVQSVSLTAPSAGATLAGSVTVRASANAATKVEFWLDGVRKATDSTSPYSWTWDTSGSGDGAHQLIAKAYNGTNLLGSTAARTITVDNTSAGNCSDPTEPNNTSSTGTWLPLGSSTNAYICTASDVDWFRIPVTAAGLINVTLVVPAGLDFDLELYGTDGAWQAGSYHGVGQTENITFNAYSPGTYYARVYGYPAGNGSHSTTAAYTITVQMNAANGMALIPAGSFTMGNNLDNTSAALPLHSVYISAFYMDKYDVTKALWDSVCEWATSHGYNFSYAGSGKGANHPVQTISWFDAVKWCNARSEMEGKLPAYYTSAAQTTVYRTGQVNVDNNSVNWNSGYRLPTEAEWEKAARGGLSGQRFPWGNTISWSQANYYALPSAYSYDINPTQGFHPAFASGGYPYTSPVGYFAPNGYGLYDMVGNVFQWCWDWYGGYDSTTQTDPRGSASGGSRIYRGGSYGDSVFMCRTTLRNDFGDPTSGYNYTGFRSALPVVASSNAVVGLNDGLVAYYPFNGNAHDESGNGNNGVVYGAILTTNRFGASNSAYDFKGSSYIAIPQNSSLNSLITNFTISAWIFQRNINQNFGSRILDKCPAGIPNGWTFDTWDGITYRRLRLQGVVSSSANVVGATAYSLMQWHHVVATISGTTANLYLDGNLDGTGNVGNIPQNALDIFIGRAHPYGADNGDKEYFDGLIDDVRIYSRLLSASEIQDLYNIFDGQQITATFTVLAQPASHRSSVGDSTVFSVAANGTGSLGYQWQRNGTDIPGATGLTYTTPPLSLSDSGALYLVRVNNAFDSLFSAPAVLTVTVPRISNPLLTINGNIQFDVNSDDTRPHIIEVSTNLVNWSSIATNTPVNGVFSFSDAVTSGLRQRFYRAVVR